MTKYYDSVGRFHVDLSNDEEKEISKELKELRYKLKETIFSDIDFKFILEEKIKDINSIASITTNFNSNSSGNNAKIGRRVLENIEKNKFHECNFKEEWLIDEIVMKGLTTLLTSYNALNIRERITELENKLVTSGLKAAVTLALKYNNVLDPNDAIQQANLGLIEAAKRFDPDKGVKFITFAYHKMEYKLRHQSSIDTNNVVRIPAKDRHSYASGWLSLEEDVDVGRQRALQDILPDKESEDLDSLLDKKKIKEGLKSLLYRTNFDQREVLIIYYRYLFSSRVLTYQEVADKMAEETGESSLSRERIRQLENRAIDKLQRHKNELKELFDYFN